jgi:hypothetical protein
MTIIRFFKLAGLLCLLPQRMMAQKEPPTDNSKHQFSVYLGTGPNVYFNNLQLAKDRVNVVNYSFTGRFMWEPGHFLSLGLETGYYRLYSLKTTGPDNAFISNSAIPIQIVVSMKFLRSCYFNVSMGQSLLFNEASASAYGNFDARSFSLGDFTGTLGYKYPLKGRFSIGAETKYFYSSRANDCSLALVFIGGYSF